jgi:hypothetical protein
MLATAWVPGDMIMVRDADGMRERLREFASSLRRHTALSQASRRLGWLAPHRQKPSRSSASKARVTATHPTPECCNR